MRCRFGEIPRVLALALAGFLILAPVAVARATTADAVSGTPAATPADDAKKDAKDTSADAKTKKKAPAKKTATAKPATTAKPAAPKAAPAVEVKGLGIAGGARPPGKKR